MKKIFRWIIILFDKIYSKIYNESNIDRGVIWHTLPKMDTYWNFIDLNNDLYKFSKRHWVEVLKELYDILNIEYYSRIQKIMQMKKYEDISMLWYTTDILNSISEVLFDNINGND